MIKVSTLKKNPSNPRQIKGEKLELLKASVGGFQKMMALRPMIVDENNVVLGGNMRLAAIKALGLKEIPDDWVKQVTDLTADEKAEFVIKDNNSFGEYDWDAIANEWSDYPLADWGLDVPGFEAVDEVGTADAEPQIDKAAELNKKWGVVSGDLWQIGEHRLLCGDSTKREDVDLVTDGGKVQMTFTDPPYNVDYGANNNPRHKIRTIENDNLGEDFPAFITLVLSLLLSKTEGAIYICMSDKEWARMFGILESLDAHWSSTIVWVKDQLVLSPKDYHSRHELIWYGWGKHGRRLPLADRTQTDIWECDRPKRSDEHPTMKPVPLVQRAIENSSKSGERVYEPFAGSGTTLVACENLNRKCYAIEISESYCAVILERMKTAFPDLEIKRLSDSANSDELNTNGNKGSDRKLAQSKANNA